MKDNKQETAEEFLKGRDYGENATVNRNGSFEHPHHLFNLRKLLTEYAESQTLQLRQKVEAYEEADAIAESFGWNDDAMAKQIKSLQKEKEELVNRIKHLQAV